MMVMMMMIVAKVLSGRDSATTSHINTTMQDDNIHVAVLLQLLLREVLESLQTLNQILALIPKSRSSDLTPCHREKVPRSASVGRRKLFKVRLQTTSFLFIVC